MEREVLTSSKLNERCVKLIHESGLTIVLQPIEKCSMSTAIFGTKFGSEDNLFKLSSEKEFCSVPDGTAHFLEHKLFENEDGVNSLFLLSEKGAFVNAGTSYDRTFYYFSCTENFEEFLKILINFVQNPYFTRENVEKEKGIIEQEIKMYEDSPRWRVYYDCLNCLYFNHPIKIRISGSEESVSKIDEKVLYRCYDAFYNLSNMYLVIAGDFNEERVVKIIESELKNSLPVNVDRKIPDEPSNVVRNFSFVNLPISVPCFHAGYKLSPPSSEETLKFDVSYGIVFELLVGRASGLFSTLRDEGLILEDKFSYEVINGNGFYALIFSGESGNSRLLFKKLNEEIELRKKIGFSKESFEAEKRAAYGEVIAQFESSSSFAGLIFDSLLLGNNPYDILDLIANLTFEDVMDCLNRIDVKNFCLSVGVPKS